MKTLYRLFLTLFALSCILSCVACKSEADNAIESSVSCASELSEESVVSEEVTDFLKEYLDVTMDSVEEAVEYVYFNNDWEKGYYTNCSDYVVDYEILSSEKINDDLNAFLISYTNKSDQEQGTSKNAYNFVAVIDGEYRIITNVRNIPEDLKDGLDETKYSSDSLNTDDTISPDEVLGTPSDFD